MSKALLFGRLLALAIVIAAIVSKSAQAAPYTPPSSARCSEPPASQLFAPWGDANSYAIVTGPRICISDGTSIAKRWSRFREVVGVGATRNQSVSG